MSEPPPAPPPSRTIAAARRLVGPARSLHAAARVLWVVAAGAGALLWLESFTGVLLGGPPPVGYVVALLMLVVLLAPAWWLRHARDAFADLVVLPERLETLQTGRPRFSIDSREDLAALRHGGVVSAARTLRRTIGEVTDFVSPATTVAEVATPVFWVWTAVAVVATAVFTLLALTVGPLLVLL